MSDSTIKIKCVTCTKELPNHSWWCAGSDGKSQEEMKQAQDERDLSRIDKECGFPNV